MNPIGGLLRRLIPTVSTAFLLSVVGCGENSESPTSPQLEPAVEADAVAALSLRQVSVGFFHACGVSTSGSAYCWGENTWGQLGNGTTTSSQTPVAVAGGLSFRQITAGDNSTCGVATDDLTYCWGYNGAGQLGDETTAQRLTPTRVHAGGLKFRRVTAGASFVCGETANDLAYCWGANQSGQLGIGTTATTVLKPVPVSGGRRFSQLSAGRFHACGITPTNVAFCWGENSGGQLGLGTKTGPETCSEGACSTKPVKVAGGLRFRQINGGTDHTCAVTHENVAYCWGQNERGRLGNGTYSQSSLTPSKVRGGIRFRTVSAGGFSTCGITPDDRAYCWGYGGTLGDGTTADQRTPVRVTGGLLFRQLDVGPVFTTCGVTTGGRGYCWGTDPAPVPDPS